MKNKIKVTAISTLLLSSIAAPTVSFAKEPVAVNVQVNGKFTDVDKKHYANEAIQWAQQRGIVSGYTDNNGKPNGKFGPNDSVTEAQFAKMLAEFYGFKDDKGKLNKFTPTPLWSDTYYDALAAYGVPLNGYLDSGLRNKSVKRGVVAQAIGHLSGNANSLTDSINFMIGEGITTGQNPQYENSDLFKYFGANNTLTRAQAVAFLYRMHNIGINRAEGIAVSVYNNKEGLSLAILANKAVSKLDSSLKLGNIRNETSASDGGNNNGDNSKPPVENKPDFSGAKLPVSDSATAKDVNVTDLNKVATLFSSKTIDLFEKNGYEISNAYDGIFFTKSFSLAVIDSKGSSVKYSFIYDKGVDLNFVKSIVKDLSGVTLNDADFSKTIGVEREKVHILHNLDGGKEINIHR
ncbi:S-layer homology domain-containing protein [Lysinibacillus sp. NPDC097231]|uniref:S-layer homology domain-containing protein n=1 Tax=Lysinibacillus sp. NPDC097231 TaxID=3364142 RepID=UPI00381CBE8F